MISMNRKMIAACVVTSGMLAGLAMGLTSMEAAEKPAAEAVSANAYNLDAVHSSVIFSIRHAGVANFYGRFNSLEADINWNGDQPDDSSFVIRIDAASVDTNNERRDAHLRNPDFFNAPEFPHVTFTSTSVERDGDHYMVTGELELIGTSRTISVPLRHTGSAEHRSGRELIGLEADFTIKRSEWNMNYGIDAGALGDEVRLIISLEAIAAE